MADKDLDHRGRGHTSKKTFAEHQFAPGVSGNPHGRRGKPSNAPPASQLSSHDESILALFEREVRQPDGSSLSLIDAIMLNVGVAAARRQPHGNDAGSGGPTLDHKAARMALSEYRQASEARAAYANDAFLWIATRKDEIEEQFRNNRRLGKRPPDIVPHPDHVIISGSGGVRLCGPLTPEARAVWELSKYRIRECAMFEKECRELLRQRPNDPDLLENLANSRRSRRRWMRIVPKGWNWREQIWTLDADPQSYVRTLEFLNSEKYDGEFRSFLIEYYGGPKSTYPQRPVIEDD